MSFRVVHHEGTKEAVIDAVKQHAEALKQHEDKDFYDDGEWEAAVEAVSNGDFSSSELAARIISLEIDTSFPPVGEDWGIEAYEQLAQKTQGRLHDALAMFENGRHFSSGEVGFGDEATCGYLTADEVKELLELLNGYNPDIDSEYEKEFVESLVEICKSVADKGDLFLMN